MAVTCTRVVTLTYTGDVVGTETMSAASNIASPGMMEVKALPVGFTAVAVPLAGTVPTAVTIVPPAGNSNSITLKGVTGDTGIRLHNTDPTTIALDSSVTTIGLTIATATTNIRFYWS